MVGSGPPAEPRRPYRLLLNGTWQLRFGPQKVAARSMARPDIPSAFAMVPASVPGNVELDLVRAGRLPADLDHGQNIYRLLPYELHQWWYVRAFDVPYLAALS